MYSGIYYSFCVPNEKVLQYVDITQVLFDHDGCLKKYTTVMEILQEFYEVRVDLLLS